MRKVDIINKIMGNKIKQFGFVSCRYNYYDGWHFRKVLDNGIEQYVAIQKSPFDLSIRLMIWSSEHQSGLDIREICNDDGVQAYYPYQNEDDFSQIVEMFTDIFIEYGMKKLDDISKPSPYVSPSKENYYRLYTEHEELSAQFEKRFCIQKKADLKQALDIICKVIEDNGSKEYNLEVEELLLQANAFYGEVIIGICGGMWWWDWNLEVCALAYFNSSKEKKTAAPLKWMFYCWQINDASYFREEYEEIVNS